MKNNLKKLTKENLLQIILDMNTFLSKEQQRQMENLIAQYTSGSVKAQTKEKTVRMSQEFVDEKMRQLKIWMNQIDEGELTLDVEEYEDYSEDYWDRDWVTEYYDNQGIGDKLLYAIQLAKDCVDDCRYQEANFIYEWLWAMEVCAESEYSEECDPADLQDLIEHDIIRTDLKQLALLTLYAAYQALDADRRAENLYLYFSHRAFQDLHLEDMLQVGREELAETARFWEDWITLLKKEEGDVEARLLQEAVLYQGGVERLGAVAEEVCNLHPSLYLAAMEAYHKRHEYEQIEKIAETALIKINKRLKIRGDIALKAAYAASCLSHDEQMMRFCWECFCSDTTVRNYLRLFGTKEMAQQYGMRGKEVLFSGLKGERDIKSETKSSARIRLANGTIMSFVFIRAILAPRNRRQKIRRGHWDGVPVLLTAESGCFFCIYMKIHSRQRPPRASRSRSVLWTIRSPMLPCILKVL